MICYRHCDYRTPLRSSFQAQRRPGRFHRGHEEEPTQYLCVHPLGPHAEALRRYDARTPAAARLLDLRTWALEVDTGGLVEIPFADTWVDDDYTACQDLADTMRESDRAGMIVPSAALPGTRNVVVFGGRTAAPYGLSGLGATEVSAGITGEHGCGLETLVELVRFRGEPHPGGGYVFREPSWAA
ncbi:MAG TPA: RES family NAD+ phosphorylase [Gaiellaceae bacterium]|nr:RES family NAD+ phosphorylase [Gaiellaceae bacterium]